MEKGLGPGEKLGLVGRVTVGEDGPQVQGPRGDKEEGLGLGLGEGQRGCVHGIYFRGTPPGWGGGCGVPY